MRILSDGSGCPSSQLEYSLADPSSHRQLESLFCMSLEYPIQYSVPGLALCCSMYMTASFSSLECMELRLHPLLLHRSRAWAHSTGSGWITKHLSSKYVPAGQPVHVVAPSAGSEILPSGQRRQSDTSVAPFLLEYVPVVHASQDEAPQVVVSVPATNKIHYYPASCFSYKKNSPFINE